jgi:hypothetical protein
MVKLENVGRALQVTAARVRHIGMLKMQAPKSLEPSILAKVAAIHILLQVGREGGGRRRGGVGAEGKETYREEEREGDRR